MTTLNKQAVNRLNRLDRKSRNAAAKGLRKLERQRDLVELGKSLIPGKRTVTTGFVETEVPHRGNQRESRKILQRVTEVKDVLVSPTGPKNSRGRLKEPTHFRSGYGNSASLVFLGGKSFPHHGAQRKTRPGEKELHTTALIENAEFVPTPKPTLTPDIPVIDPEKLPEIGAQQ